MSYKVIDIDRALNGYLPRTAGGISAAALSSCEKYRYALVRRWDYDPLCVFFMLNPSTADAHEDDPTIRRCIGFAKSWGYGGIAVGNLFALRATDPSELRRSRNPHGDENSSWWKRLYELSSTRVAAWGNHGRHLDASSEFLSEFPDLWALGVTKIGEPKHPLYLSKGTEIVPPCTWMARRAAR